jgi:outer membrane usher protein
VPFGAEVVDAKGHSQGVVGQGGLALLRVTDDHGRLNANWHNAQATTSNTCRFDYTLPASAGQTSARSVIDVTCDALPTTPSSEGKS